MSKVDANKPENNVVITKASMAKQFIGQKLFWNQPYSGWTYSGICEGVQGRNILIDGDWKWFSDLKKLRNYK